MSKSAGVIDEEKFKMRHNRILIEKGLLSQQSTLNHEPLLGKDLPN
jgi:hypothetical protein